MPAPVITVENLGKDYVISHLSDGAAYRTLRDTLSQWLKPGRFQRSRPQSEIFSALNEVSFEVQPGEVLGIIGRNGAGKSTLLKILSRITEPTRGRVRLRGRVASLLEVGTGFHPELTGRENIFLNGAILGMTRAEIRRKFDEIVDFSGVEKFLDTPVKRYSSGMYVRLAFAVAAHLEPEILIIDEVLAVGDQEFQKKCLGKMHDVATSEGRTVLFVSHNLAAVRLLCNRCLLLNAGRIETLGPVTSTLLAYTNAADDPGSSASIPDTSDLPVSISSCRLENATGQAGQAFRVGETWRMRFRLRIRQSIPGFVASVGIVNSGGAGVQTAWIPPSRLGPGEYEAVFEQDRVHLASDSYKILVGLSTEGRMLLQYEASSLEILPEDPLIHCEATSGCGLVLNSMRSEIRSLP